MESPGLVHERAASDLLEDALQQFDSIIEMSSEPMNITDLYKNGGIIGDGFQGIGQLMDDLKMTIEAEEISSENGDRLLCYLSPSTLQFYRDLFKTGVLKKETNDEITHRLMNENKSLTLQVSVLTDQVDLQMEKIQDLETTLKELQSKLSSAEESLQQEILARTKHESESLALMEQLSDAKIQLVQHEQLERKVLGSNIMTPRTEDPVPDSPREEIRISYDPEMMSPDEGIVHDHIQDKVKLKMPEPSATSTPIAIAPNSIEQSLSLRLENNADAETLGTPKSSTKTQITQGINLAQNYRSVSLERLHGHRIAPVAATQSISMASSEVAQKSNNVQAGVTVPDSKESLKESSAKSSSSPNLAMTETGSLETDSQVIESTAGNTNNSNHSSPFHNRKKHGFKKFFSSFRLRRSHSSNLQNASELTPSPTWPVDASSASSSRIAETEASFKRGGLRATAGPRLGWSKATKPISRSSSNLPFAQWKTDEVCDWLTELGLAAYISSCKSWVKNGATLLQATNQDLEKELGIRNPLHKKKLMISLQALGEEDELDGQMIKGGKMDMVWVSRWLDDIGLPQYKDSFHEACIDGRMLHHLTMADLQRLRVLNLLHTLSLRRAIYTLRLIGFDPIQLKRRPIENEDKEDVLLWTNHRVMEWLRSIDLAEYAPNLRGSGVHGSLMVLEPLFTGEIMGSLLHIPNSKSLLRRHLTAKFNDLIPAEYAKFKLAESSSSALNITAKVKIGRRSFGPLSRLRGSSSGYTSREFSSGEFVCPIETKNSGIHRSFGSHRRELEARLHMQEAKDRKAWELADEENPEVDVTNDSGDIKVVELDESTTRKIGAFSAELATMTNKWTEDK